MTSPSQARPWPSTGDAARQSATQRDGALALAVGAAANECFLSGQPVLIADLMPGLVER